MRKLISGIVFGAIALSVPAAVAAQRQPAGARHEYGVDVGAAYVKEENVDGGIVIGTPLDVRVGIVPRRGNMMWEPRFSLVFNSTGGSTAYAFSPGVNVLFANSPGGHRRGMYITGGAALVLADNGVDSGTLFSLNGGVGWRKPTGTAAWRYELGFQWSSENTSLGVGSTIAIGGRVGISLWK